eukprot:3854310-Pleurochrysis_carterae.AAC.1
MAALLARSHFDDKVRTRPDLAAAASPATCTDIPPALKSLVQPFLARSRSLPSRHLHSCRRAHDETRDAAYSLATPATRNGLSPTLPGRWVGVVNFCSTASRSHIVIHRNFSVPPCLLYPSLTYQESVKYALSAGILFSTFCASRVCRAALT